MTSYRPYPDWRRGIAAGAVGAVTALVVLCIFLPFGSCAFSFEGSFWRSYWTLACAYWNEILHNQHGLLLEVGSGVLFVLTLVFVCVGALAMYRPYESSRSKRQTAGRIGDSVEK